MKNIKKIIFPLSLVLLLAACRSNSGETSKNNSSESKSEASSVVSSSSSAATTSTESTESSVESISSSEAPAPKNIVLVEPEDTSMLTENCKAYIDDVRASIGDDVDPYKYHEIALNIEDSTKAYLDTGDVDGQNRTVSGKIPNRSDKSLGVDLHFESSLDLEPSDYKVLVSLDENDFSKAKEYDVGEGFSVNVKNLFVNTEYYWKVVSDAEESEVGSFTTGDYPRWITCRSLTGEEEGRGIYNVRDLGGYMTESGQRVKQGLVYRGGEITTMTSSGHYNTITQVAKKAFREDMGMVGGVELDLRGASDISDGYKACGFAEDGDIEYVQKAIKSYEQTFTQPNNDDARQMVRDIFEILKNADQKPVYFHCFGGADRTGTIGFMLNGLLGVSYEDLVIDFELTSYSSINNEHIRNHLDGHQHQYDRWPKLIQQIQTDTTGGYAWDDDALLMDNIENYLVKACGVPQETIDTIRDIMLED